VLRVGRWVRDRLLMFDLGYFRYQLFDCIDRNGGYFISRLKENANPEITATLRQWRGRSVSLVGERLRDVVERLQRETLDVEVEVAFRRRAYGGRRSGARRRLRLVGVKNEDTGRYHL
jgi:IS4 transposase